MWNFNFKVMEKEIGRICKECLELLGGPLSEMVATAITKGYELGFERCKKLYGINDEKFLKEQSEIENV